MGALPQTLMGTGAGPWMLLALVVLPFALFGYLLLFFLNKRRQMAVSLKVRRQTHSSLL